MPSGLSITTLVYFGKEYVLVDVSEYAGQDGYVLPGADILEGDPDLPAFLTRLMVRLDVDQDGLADKLGVKQTAISRWMSGTRQPHPDNRDALARVAGVDVAAVGGVIARTERHREKSAKQIEREHIREMAAAKAEVTAALAEVAALRKELDQLTHRGRAASDR
jgi:transcriptional regulator with XRE-family HTH domain